MKHPETNPSSCAAGSPPHHAEMPAVFVPPTGPAGPVCSAADRGENLHANWETAWIDLGGEG